MNIKKISLLVASALVFLLVMTTIFKTISKSLYIKGEKEIKVLNRKNKTNEMLANMVKSYNYIEVSEVEESQEEVVQEIKEEVKVVAVPDTKKEEVVEEVSATEDNNVYTGKLTGYGADCAGCSGYVACRTPNGKVNLRDGYYYNDTAYGSVRILSAATSAFPCGTIIQVNNGIMGEFTAIVLDTGGSMRSAWSRGEVWMDLAFSSNSDAGIRSANSTNTTFKVLRQGW